MDNSLTLTANDGHQLAAYCAQPENKPRAAIVVIQEIFGVNGHIRDICDRLAAQGYAAVAPALFDRIEPGVELDYDEPGVARGRDLKAAMIWENAVADLAAAVDAARQFGAVGVVGFCWGGSLAWLAATRLNSEVVVGFYGGQIVDFLDETPNCPMLLHFGEQDTAIPLADVEKIRLAHPRIPVHLYPGGHGFNCDRRASYHADSAALAWDRTMEFLRKNLA
ncbi:MAG: dienelactone hydrolase family protein [Rhodospirillales bacterium]|jgi:carboxymethylenebutenolidase|nr:dienelactone hydrolase family protein [Rhodospirillales bacterium]